MSEINIGNFIGYLATAVTTVSLLPQVVKTWRSKSAEDISFGMCFLGMLAGILWLVYGIFFTSVQMVITNGIVFVCFLIILILKIKYK